MSNIDDQLWKDWCDKCRALSLKKRIDYASQDDPLKNLRLCGSFGIVTRISDKLMRLVNLLNPEYHNQAVKDETIDDTIMDLFNYAFLLYSMRQETTTKPKGGSK